MFAYLRDTLVLSGLVSRMRETGTIHETAQLEGDFPHGIVVTLNHVGVLYRKWYRECVDRKTGTIHESTQHEDDFPHGNRK